MSLLDQMRDFFLLLFSGSGYMPRTECGTWTPVLLRTYVTADVIIAFAYFAIPICILWAYKRFGRSTPLPVEARIVCSLFGTFIVACGLSHLVDATIFVHPVYRLQTLVLSVTALCSVLTAFVAPRLIHRLGDAQQTIYEQEESIQQYRDNVNVLEGRIREMQAVVEGYIKMHPDGGGGGTDATATTTTTATMGTTTAAATAGSPGGESAAEDRSGAGEA